MDIHKNIGTFEDNRIGYVISEDRGGYECIYAKALCNPPWTPELDELDELGKEVTCKKCLKLMEMDKCQKLITR